MLLQSDDVLKAIRGFDTLEDLEKFVRSLPERSLRKFLFQLFDERAEYRHARDWAEAVRICEALAIIGWGDRERVDAVCEQQENLWRTQFLTGYGDCRFLNGNWTKRKLGYILHNPEYCASPDRPDKPDIDWKTYGRLHAAEFQIVPCDILPSQRNSRRPCPIFLGGISGRDRTSRAVEGLRMELYRHLCHSISGDAYGIGLKTLDVCFVTWSEERTLKPGLQPGRYTPKSEVYRCYFNFEKAFYKRSRSDQQAYIAAGLLAAIDHASGLLRKNSLAYDMLALRADVERVLEEWLTTPQGGTPAKAMRTND